MISMIACIDKNSGIGNKNKLLYNIKEDMLFFRSTTMSKGIVMGYNTYLSIGKHLDGRDNIVISRNSIDAPYIVMDIKEVVDKYKDSAEEVFIIGGAKTYSDFLEYSQNLYLTYVEDEKKADTFFPKFNEEDYTMEVLSSNKTSEGINYSMRKYVRK